MKIKLIAVCLSVAATSIVTFPVSAISDTTKGAISTNCGTIKQALQQLAKADSSTRIVLGTTYESILTNFITPLNLRLVKNNQPSSALTTIQSDFVAGRSQFASSYTDYMRELEALIAIDCRQNPEGFYEQLETARGKRATLQQNTLKLNSLLHDQVTTVTKLKESL